MVAPSGGSNKFAPSGGFTYGCSFGRIQLRSLLRENSTKVTPSGGFTYGCSFGRFKLRSLHQEDSHMVAPSGGSNILLHQEDLCT